VAGEDGLRALIEARRKGPLTVVRDAKGIKRTVQVGHYLRDVVVGAGSEALLSAGIGGELVSFTFEVLMTGQGGARPSEVLQVLLGDAEIPVRLVRMFLGKGELSPMKLEALRALVLAAAGDDGASAEPSTLDAASSACSPEGSRRLMENEHG
jgi:hypothetical protein